MAEDFEKIFAGADFSASKPGMTEQVNTKPIEQPPVTTTTETIPPVTTQTTPPTTTETTPAATTTATSDPVKSWLKEKLNTEDENAVITRYNGYDTLSQKAAEADTLKTKFTELETQNKQLAERPTYKSDFARKADEIYETTKGTATRETIARFYGLNTSELKDEEALDLLKQIESPTLTAEERKILREETYSVEDESLTPGQKVARKDKYSQDVTNARNTLSKFASEAFKPLTIDNKPTIEEVQAEQSRIGYWEQNSGKLDGTVFNKTLPDKISVPNGKGGVDEIDSTFNYVVPQEKQQKLMGVIAKELTNPANAKYFTADNDGIQKANTYVKSIVYTEIFDDALKAQQAHYKSEISKIHESYAKLYHNPNLPGAGTVEQAGKAGEVDYNKSAEEYNKRAGG